MCVIMGNPTLLSGVVDGYVYYKMACFHILSRDWMEEMTYLLNIARARKLVPK
jgi:hypothetical protein